MRLALALLSLLPIWASGYATQRLLGIRRGGAADIVLDFVIGITLLAVMGTLALAFGTTPHTWWVIVLTIVLAAFAFVRHAPSKPFSTRTTREHLSDRAVRWWVAAVAVVVVFLLATSLTDRLTWDGWAIWTLKARILFFENSFPTDVFSKPGPFEFAHPEYPLALPLLQWWMFRHAGAPLPEIASFTGALWVIAIAVLVWSFLRGRAPIMVTGLTTLGVVLFRPLTEGATGGTADIIMSVAVLGAITEITQARAESLHDTVLRASCYLALAALTKNEGLALALLAAFVFALTARNFASRRRSFWLLFIPVALGVAWYGYTRSWGLEVEQIGAFPPPGEWLTRAGAILRAFAALTIHHSWPPVFALAVVGAGALLRPHPSYRTSFGWILIGGYLAVVMGVYWSTSLDLPWLLQTSLDRVVGHIVPALVVLVVSQIWSDAEKKNGEHLIAPRFENLA